MKLEEILEYASSLADLRMARGDKRWSQEYSGIPTEVGSLLGFYKDSTPHIKLTIQRLIALVEEAKALRKTDI